MKNLQKEKYERSIYHVHSCFFPHRKENEVLQTETQMFEKYLKRNEPKDSLGLPSAGLASGVTQSGSQQDVGRGVGRKRSKSRTSNINTSLRLTTEQKCDIAQKEIDDLKDEIEQLKENCEKVLDTYKVSNLKLTRKGVEIVDKKVKKKN